MPPKIRDLKRALRKAGCLQISGGKGSHSKWEHPLMLKRLTLSGHDGDDAQSYQEKFVSKYLNDIVKIENEMQ